MRHETKNSLYIVSTVIMLAALIVKAVFETHLAGYGLVFGAMIYLFIWMSYSREKYPIRTKRLLGMAVLSGILLLTSGITMSMNQNWWLILLLIGIILMMYSNISLASALGKKEKK